MIRGLHPAQRPSAGDCGPGTSSAGVIEHDVPLGSLCARLQVTWLASGPFQHSAVVGNEPDAWGIPWRRAILTASLPAIEQPRSHYVDDDGVRPSNELINDEVLARVHETEGHSEDIG